MHESFFQAKNVSCSWQLQKTENLYIYICKRVMNQTTSVALKVHTLSNITTNPKSKHFDDPDADWNGRRRLHPNLCVYKPRF